MSEIEQTFNTYIAAARAAWRTHSDYQFGGATPRMVHEANAREAAAERAHREAMSRLLKADQP
jgi:hypothetical protein